MEVALRRLDGVADVSISLQKQTVQITYEPGTSFQPEDIRAAVARAEVEIVRFQIAARGRVQEEGSKRFFVAGKDKLLLVDSPKVPSGHPIWILGTIDDSGDPLELKVAEFKIPKR
ncbi:MAG: heavy-metal-associated domain-containing protein [Acidobacteria bacterium]|nr:heavy-metal-associated domain-containing protein [Acidobacteriota bacterium]